MKRPFLVALITTTALSTTTALAQEIIDLDPIIVSGGFTPIKEQTYGHAASVMTSEEIEERGILTVQDALRAMPGVSVSGAGHSYTQVRIRGGESNHTLILIDGIPAIGGDSEYILSGLQTANIDRIEVIRGPQSVFYGSNASSGVINIITRKGGIGRELGGSVEVGNGYAASARYSFRTDRGGIAVNLSRLDDHGYDYSGSEGEKDGLDRSTAQLSGDYLLTDRLKIGFFFSDSREDYAYDSTNFMATTPEEYIVDDPVPAGTRDERLYEVYGEYEALDGRMLHRFSYDATDFESESNEAAPASADRKRARYLLSYGLDGNAARNSNHLLNAILEWEKDSSSTNPSYNRETRSYALEYRGQLANGLNLQAGARYDDNETFEDDVTWTLAGSYQFSSGVRLHASAGTGIVDPTYFELFANAFGYVGNPDLKPEKNESIDLGVEFPVWQGRGLFDVTVFHNELTDEITPVFDPASSTNTYVNQSGNSTRSGVEVSGTIAATDSLDLRLSYTFLDAKNPDGSIEQRRPRHELLLSATQEFMGGRGQITADLLYVADNYDTQYFGSFATEKLPNYVTVDLAAQYALTDTVQLTGRIVNLFDEEYSDVWGYASRGRTAYVGLRAAF